MKKVLCLLALVVSFVFTASAAELLVTTIPATFYTMEGLQQRGSLDLRVNGDVAVSTTTFGSWEKTYNPLFPGGLKSGTAGSVSFDPKAGDGIVWVGYGNTRYAIPGLLSEQPNAAILSVHGGLVVGFGGRQLPEGNYLIRNSDGSALGRFQAPVAILSGNPAAGIGYSMFQTQPGAFAAVPEPHGGAVLATGLSALLFAFRRRSRLA